MRTPFVNTEHQHTGGLSPQLNTPAQVLHSLIVEDDTIVTHNAVMAVRVVGVQGNIRVDLQQRIAVQVSMWQQYNSNAQWMTMHLMTSDDVIKQEGATQQRQGVVADQEINSRSSASL